MNIEIWLHDSCLLIMYCLYEPIIKSSRYSLGISQRTCVDQVFRSVTNRGGDFWKWEDKLYTFRRNCVLLKVGVSPPIILLFHIQKIIFFINFHKRCCYYLIIINMHICIIYLYFKFSIYILNQDLLFRNIHIIACFYIDTLA